LPWYVDLVLMFIGGPQNVVDLRALRAMRLVRMFKLSRMAPQLRMIGSAMERSQASLVFLLMMMSFALLTFSTLIWMVERGNWDEKQKCYARDIPEHDCSPYDSIPGSSWWVLTTMTTVGYGDVFPKTNIGRLVGALCMVCGILAVAMPTTVLSIQFAEAYEDIVKEEAGKVLRKAEAEDISKHDSREAALRHGLDSLQTAEEQLAVVLKNIEQNMMRASAGDPGKQKRLQASLVPLMATAMQAQTNSRLFLESYQS